MKQSGTHNKNQSQKSRHILTNASFLCYPEKFIMFDLIFLLFFIFSYIFYTCKKSFNRNRKFSHLLKTKSRNLWKTSNIATGALNTIFFCVCLSKTEISKEKCLIYSPKIEISKKQSGKHQRVFICEEFFSSF